METADKTAQVLRQTTSKFWQIIHDSIQNRCQKHTQSALLKWVVF